jgi:hypothetical protein
MSKSTLSITVVEPIFKGAHTILPRTIEVPCRLPEAFNFKHDGCLFTANLYESAIKGLAVATIKSEDDDGSPFMFDGTDAVAASILATIKAALGITGPVPPGSPLPAIALAYEAECAAYDSCVKALHYLPPYLWGIGTTGGHPSDETATGVRSNAARLLAKYVEYVVEQASKPQTKRSESKVTP